MEQTMYYVGIEGHTWGGFDGELELEFSAPPTSAMVKAKAGDFESYTIMYANKVTTVTEIEAIDVV